MDPGTVVPDADLRVVLRGLPGMFLLLTPELVIAEATDEFLRNTMTQREQLIGRYLFDVFPDDPNDLDASGVSKGRASFARVLQHKRPDTMNVLRFPIRTTAGEFEERYWTPHNVPVLGADGWVKYIIQRVEDVTDVVRLKREALEREHGPAPTQRLERLRGTAQDALVVIGEDSRIVTISAHTEQMFGYSEQELLGQPLEVLLPERFRAPHREHLSEYFAKPTARALGVGPQLFGRRKDGSELAIEISLLPERTPDGVLVAATIRDVSERVRLQAQAALTAERLHSAVDSIVDSFALFDADDRLIVCNSPFRRLMNAQSGADLVGKTFRELLDTWITQAEFADADARERYRAQRLASFNQELTSTVDVSFHDGRRLRVIDRRTPEGGMVKTIYDRTDDELRAQELQDAKRQAEAASAAKSEFLSSMSHELRTPLNAILGFAQLLERDKREPLSPRHRDRVDHIVRGGEHLLRLINDILDLSKIEAGQVPLTFESVVVGELLDDVRSTLEPLATSRGISLGVTMGSSAPRVEADRTRLRQILINFGSNAIKYNRPDGSVQFVVDASSPTHVRITVRDTGMGIPLDQQAKLFQPFQRAGQELGSIEGTGIGLVITRGLAERMHGSVGFSSTPGEGSAFWVDMPMIASEVVSAEPVRVAGERATVRGQVVYIEDNLANVDLVRDIATSLGELELLTAPTAEAGIELARARKPSAIVMDINLPGISGVEALRRLRALPETAKVPVIALTAAASERDRASGLAAGFFAYLTKPLKIDDLVEALQAALSR